MMALSSRGGDPRALAQSNALRLRRSGLGRGRRNRGRGPRAPRAPAPKRGRRELRDECQAMDCEDNQGPPHLEPKRRVRGPRRDAQPAVTRQGHEDVLDDGHEQARTLMTIYTLASPLEALIRAADINNRRLIRTVQMYYDRLESNNNLREGDWRPSGQVMDDPSLVETPVQ